MSTRQTTRARRWLAPVLGVALVTAAVPALLAAQGPGAGLFGGHGGRMGRMGPGGGPMGAMAFGLGRLGLTDQQREQVRTLMQGHRPELQALAQRAAAAHTKVNAAVTASPVDESAIRSASAELADVQADGAILRAKIRQEVMALLTPEQQAKAKTLRDQMEQRQQERQQRMQDRIKARSGAQPQ